jgi:hypothetical protein
MKIANLRLYLVLLMAFAIVGVACNNEDETDPAQALDPTIVFNNAGGARTTNDSVEVNTIISINAAFSKGNDGKNLRRIYVEVSPTAGAAFTAVSVSNLRNSTGGALLTGNDATNYTTNGYIDVPNSTETYTAILGDFAITGVPGQKYTIRFRVEDADNRSATRTLEFTIRQPVGPTPTAPKMFMRTLNSGNTGTSFTSLLDSAGMAVAPGSANSSVEDIYYFYSTTSQHNFVAPDEADNSLLTGTFVTTLSGGRATRFRVTGLSAATFDGINDESTLQGHYTGGQTQTVVGWNDVNPAAATGSRVNQDANVDAGKVIAFLTSNGKYGLIKITAANDGAASGSGSVSFTVKVQN